MKIKEITVSHTRQQQQFHPYTVSMTATLNEGENVQEAESALSAMVLKVLYKDQPKMRDELIARLCGIESKPIEDMPAF